MTEDKTVVEDTQASEKNVTEPTPELEKTVDKIDINCLYYLYVNNKKSPLNSVKIKSIMGYFNLQYAYYTIVRHIQKMVQMEYLKEGYKDKNAKTYYLCPKGIEFMESNIINTDDIYEYEIEDEGEDTNE